MPDPTMLLDDVLRAVELMTADAAGKERPTFGEIECPRCHQRLFYEVRGPRAHEGLCTTPRCLKWIG